MKSKAFPTVVILGTLAVVFIGCVVQNRPPDSSPAATTAPAATAAPAATDTANPTATATPTPAVTTAPAATGTAAPTGKVMNQPKAEGGDGGT
jgi:hypothetical protein